MSRSRRCFAGLLLAALAGCTAGADYVRPGDKALGVPAAFGERGEASSTAVVDSDWWMGFSDPILDRLVAQAIKTSPDMDAALARLRTARAINRGAYGARLPAIGVGGSIARSIGAPTFVQGGASLGVPSSATTQVVGGDTTTFQAGLQVSWDADLFGGLRRNAEATRADLVAEGFNLANTRAILVAEVTLAYLELRSAQERSAIATSQFESQNRSAEIVAWRVQAGLASSGDYQSAVALRERTAALIPTFQESASIAAHRLAILSGQAPSALQSLLTVEGGLPLAAALPAQGIPSSTIQRRPDVLAAERRVAAETARIGVERAALYPALRLDGTLGASGESLAALPAATFGNVIGNLTAPIFQGGRIRARIEAQRGRADLAFADYRSAVLNALKDVEDALASTRTSEERRKHLDAAVQASTVALAVARNRYRGGLTDFQTLLDAERTLLVARDDEAVVRLAKAQATVQLFKGLGGGWTRQ